VFDLNSILIEGVLTTAPEKFNEQGVVSFRVVSTRGERETKVRIQAHGEYGKACLEVGKIGRGVRVVGELRNDSLDGFYIEVEHIEFKPEFKTGKEKKNASI